jgi:SAM-dependent methyltransferase
MMDWNLGHYEHTAAQLLLAARIVIDRADPRGGEHVLDVGCGTGNATLLAAERGARVTGVDPAPRLLAVATAEATERGLEASFLEGDAAALPLADGAAEVVVSVFGVIFAADASVAAAELARVTARGGRIVLSAWIPEGPISESVAVARTAIARALSSPAGPAPFAWHDRRALAGLFDSHGFTVTLDQEHHAFTASSASAYLDAEFENHPLWVAGRALLEPRGEAQAVRERALEILQAGNEDRDRFSVTSRYVVATLTDSRP